MEQLWWKSGTDMAETVEQRWWNSGKEMVEQWNRYGGKVEQ